MPNIILCMGDDHAWDEAAYNGHPHFRTPVLDEEHAASEVDAGTLLKVVVNTFAG